MVFPSKEKEYVKKYNKGRYKGEFKKRQLEKVDCGCGSKIARGGLSKHKKSKHHILWETKIVHARELKALEEQIKVLIKYGKPVNINLKAELK